MPIRPQHLLLSAAVALTAVGVPMVVPRAAATDRVIVVRAGQTLSEIALQQGVSVARLVELNHLADPNRILAGQRLRVSTSSATAPKPARAKPAAVTHRVAYGETLSGIASRYRVSLTAIARANDIANVSFIRTGQVLTIPGASARAARPAPKPARAKPAAVTHRVAYGETLSGIASRYRVSLTAIARANDIANVSFIRTGQVLTIPGAGTGSAPNPAGGSRLGAPNGRMPSAMAAVVAQRQRVAGMIVAEARRQGVPAAFALAVAWQESGWQPGVVSSAGAIGVMQLLPSTGEWVASSMLGYRVNLWDPASNIRAGVRLLRHYLDRYGGSRTLTLAAYYQGQTAADRYGVFPVSRPYIASIAQLERIFGG